MAPWALAWGLGIGLGPDLGAVLGGLRDLLSGFSVFLGALWSKTSGREGKGAVAKGVLQARHWAARWPSVHGALGTRDSPSWLLDELWPKNY